MNKPIQIGQSVLDISKALMYEFYYNYLKPKYTDKIKLCYMNTESFIFYIDTNDFFEDIKDDIHDWSDTSKINNKLDRPIPIGITEGILGMFKDELKVQAMTEFISLASKVYAYICDNDKIEKKVKGIKKCVRDRVLIFKHYMDALLLNTKIRATQQIFKSNNHTITIEKINKLALTRKDDKRIQSFDCIIQQEEIIIYLMNLG